MKKIILILALLAVIATVVFVLCSRTGGEGTGDDQRKEGKKSVLRIGDVNPDKSAKAKEIEAKRDALLQAFVLRKNKKGAEIKVATGKMTPDDGIYRDDDGNPYPEPEQRLLRRADQAVEKDDVNLARETAAAALSSCNPVVRRAAVDSLAWFGENAIAELTPFLSDANPEVAEAAKDAWMQGLMEIDDDPTKVSVVEAALMGLRDGEMIDEIADELVGLDERCAIQAICDLIESANGRAVTAVKEAYESITGDEWSGVNAAEAWLQENYTPDED